MSPKSLFNKTLETDQCAPHHDHKPSFFASWLDTPRVSSMNVFRPSRAPGRCPAARTSTRDLRALIASTLYPYCRCSCHGHRSCHCLGVLSTIYGKIVQPHWPHRFGNQCVYIYNTYIHTYKSRFHPCPPVPFSFVFSMTRWLIVSHCFELPNCEIATPPTTRQKSAELRFKSRHSESCQWP